MKIIEPSVEIIDPIDADSIYRKLELCGRTCYKSEDRITAESAEKFLRGIIRRGHESVLEHQSITVKFIVSRSVANQIVRHRIASYSQESTRYCNYGIDKFGREITVIRPIAYRPGTLSCRIWEQACENAEDAYFCLLGDGSKPEEAREVLPLCLKTEVVMTANIREWRHFFRMRCSKSADSKMRQVAMMLLEQMHDALPVLLEDVWRGINNGESENDKAREGAEPAL